MSGSCPVPATGEAFLAGLLQFIDCQAQTIGASGYQALANPGSSVSIALTALLTIFGAIFGIRMLFGHTPGFGEIVVASLKVGIVLLLATSWAGYRVVAYDLVLQGPAELFGDIGSPSGLPGAQGGLLQRLQGVDDAIVGFSVIGSGRSESALPDRAGVPALPRIERTIVSDDFALGFARITYLMATIGSLAFVRVVAGLLLALAPLFAGLLLFSTTRAFFMGWLRMLVASALGALAVTVVLSIELSIVEPWLADVLALRAARYATPSAPVELLVMLLAFAAILAGVIAASVRIAFSPATPVWISEPAARVSHALQGSVRPLTSDVLPQPRYATDTSRAFQVAEAIAATHRREAALANHSADRRTAGALGSGATGIARDQNIPSHVPVGRSGGRIVRRVSASAARRSLRT